jgi:cytochrome o ubiquinol oxidase subunit 2
MERLNRVLLKLDRRIRARPRLPRPVKLTIIVVLTALVLGVFAYVVMNHPVALLQPRGDVGFKQRQLMYFAGILALIILVPVYLMTAIIAHKYRDTNKKPGKYTPDWDSHHGLEVIWWGVPCIIIIILAVVTWQSSHALDPYRSLDSSKQEVNVQVIALDWKWLFIYPEHNVAAVNELAMPVGTPVRFTITADAPMNSLWIPQLGGQVYAMPGMSTVLNLQTNSQGNYRGMSANISGRGFSGMTFTARGVAERDFDQWVAQARRDGRPLTLASYQKLAEPSEKNPVTYYSSVDSGLYDTVVMKYMGH